MKLFVVKLSCSFVLRKNFHERKLFCMTSSHNLQTQRNYSCCECFMCSRWQRTFCCYCLAFVSWKFVFSLSSMEVVEASAFSTAKPSANEYSMSLVLLCRWWWLTLCYAINKLWLRLNHPIDLIIVTYRYEHDTTLQRNVCKFKRSYAAGW